VSWRRHPEGARLPALERNILKYRAFEMVLILFHLEHLRGTIIGSVRATDRVRRRGKAPTWKDEPTFKQALSAMVAEGLVTKTEEKKIIELVDFRNLVAHEIHEMTFDVSRETFARQILQIRKPRYKYNAWMHVKKLRDGLAERMRGKYVMEISLSPSLFRAAEKTYEAELKRLGPKIDRQIMIRQTKLDQLKGELSLKGTEFTGDNFPAHPRNTTRSGNLTKRGVEVCFRLFDLGKGPLVVANLMTISLEAIKNRYKQWLAAGGMKRERGRLE
jgi:hypothetical protein